MQRAGSSDGAEWIVDGSPLRNFASCSYMGLERHPDLLAGAAAGLHDVRFELLDLARVSAMPAVLRARRDARAGHGAARARRAVDHAGSPGRAAGTGRRSGSGPRRPVRAREPAHGDRADRRRGDRARAPQQARRAGAAADRGRRWLRTHLVPLRRRLLHARRLRAVRRPLGPDAPLSAAAPLRRRRACDELDRPLRSRCRADAASKHPIALSWPSRCRRRSVPPAERSRSERPSCAIGFGAVADR